MKRLIIFIGFFFIGVGFSYAGKGNRMKQEYIFEVNFPLEHRELNLPAQVITATFNGKVIFNKPSWSHPVTEAPAMVSGLKSETNMISLHVKSKNGYKKIFTVDLKKGVYLFISFDLKKNEFSLKQQVEPPGYD